MAPADDVKVSEHPDDASLLILTLNRPARGNAMSAALIAQMHSTLDCAEELGKVAIIIHGAGKGFCAGSDIAMLAGMSPVERNIFEAESGRLARRIAAHPLPIIAAVHGFAIGGGLTLAAACDIVIATPDTKWSLPEAAIGLFPAWGLAAVAARTGAPRARRVAFGVDQLTGHAALDYGLIDELAEDPAKRAVEIGKALSSLPRAQIAAVKHYFAPGPSWETADAKANVSFAAASTTPEAKLTFSRFTAPQTQG